MYRRHIAAAERSGDKVALARAHGRLGIAYAARGELGLSELEHETALQLVEQVSDLGGQAQACINLAETRRRLGRLDQAAEAYLRAVQLAEQAGGVTDTAAQAQLGLSDLRLEEGRDVEAVSWLEKAVRGCERVQSCDADSVALFGQQRDCFVQLQRALLKHGRYEDALAAAERGKAVSLCRLLDRHRVVAAGPCVEEDRALNSDGAMESEGTSESAGWAEVSAMVQAEGGAWLLEYSVLDSETLGVWVVAPDGSFRGFQSSPISKLLGADCGAAGTSGKDALRVALARLRCALGVVNEASFGEGEGNSDESSQDMVREVSERAQSDFPPIMLVRAQEWLQSLNRPLETLASAAVSMPFVDENDRLRDELSRDAVVLDYAEAFDNPDLLDEARENLRERDDVDAWLAWLESGGADGCCDVEEGGRNINASWALMAVADHDAGLRRAAAAVRRLEGSSALQSWRDLRQLAAFRLVELNAWVSEGGGSQRLLARARAMLDDQRLLRSLHQLLMEPVLSGPPEDLPPSGATLLIVPDLDLYAVPWSALLDENLQPMAATYAVRLAPSLAVSRKAATGSSSPGLSCGVKRRLVVGNPLPLPKRFRSLQNAKSEAMMVAHQLRIDPQHTLLGNDATRTKVLELLKRAEIAHFACHGWMERLALVCSTPTSASPPIDQKDQEEQGLIRAADIQREVKLSRGSTVVLSTCDTGRGVVRGEGIVGIARAFLSAGAGAVVMSLWSVQDQGTYLFMEAFYAAFRMGYHAPQALRFAMLMMMRLNCNPVCWARFVVSGASTDLSCRLGAPQYETWSVEEVCNWLSGAQLAELVTIITDKKVDGSTLKSWTSRNDKEFKKMLKEDLGVAKVQLRQKMCKEFRCLVNEDISTAFSGPVAEHEAIEQHLPQSFDLVAMEAFMVSNHPDWFERVLKFSRGVLEDDEQTTRNWLPLKEEGQHLSSLAGAQEKEVLRVLGFNIKLHGKEIGEDMHGLLSSGMLTTEALQVLGVSGYRLLWGPNGVVCQRARALSSSDARACGPALQTAADRLEEAALYREKDMNQSCKIRPRLAEAIADAARLARTVKTSDVTILGLRDGDEYGPYISVPFRLRVPDDIAPTAAMERLMRSDIPGHLETAVKVRLSQALSSQNILVEFRDLDMAGEDRMLYGELRMKGSVAQVQDLMKLLSDKTQKRHDGHVHMLVAVQSAAAELRKLAETVNGPFGLGAMVD